MSSGMATCPVCHTLALFETTDGGDTACTNCGHVMEESAIVSQVEFIETAGGTSAVLGQYVSSTSTKPYGGSFGMSRESREAAMENARRRLQQIAGQLNIPAHFVDAGHRLYMLALTHNFTHGRKMQHVLAACLYIVCRRERSSHLLIDFAEKLRENVFLLGATYLKFVKLLSLQLPVIDPSLYIHRFAANMDLGDDAQQVANTALRIVARMKRDWIHTGRRPAGICGASILIAARVHGYRRTRAEVQHVVRVTEATIRNRLAEFQNTPSSLLTPEEFDTLEFSTECDPPSYIRGLLEEELAKEQAMLEAAVADDEQPYALTDAPAATDSVTSLALAAKPGLGICPSLPPPTEHIASQRRAETLVSDSMLQKLMNNPRIRAVVDNTLLISERDLGPHLSQLASPEVLAEQHRQNRPAEAGESAPFTLEGASFPSADQHEQATAAAESTSVPEHGFSTVGALRAAASSAGLADISKTDMRLWKVRALLQRDWGRGRESFVKLKEKREDIISKLTALQQGSDILESVSEADASEIAGNLHMLSAMVEAHDNEHDDQSEVGRGSTLRHADVEDIRAAFSTVDAPANTTATVPVNKRGRNVMKGSQDLEPDEHADLTTVQPPSKKQRTGADSEPTSSNGASLVLHSAVGTAVPRSKAQDKLDNLYVSLATEFHEELPAAGNEHAATVNRLLFDRSNISASQSVHRVQQRQEISANLVGLANKDYEEAELEVMGEAEDADAELSDLSDDDMAQYLVPTGEAKKRRDVWNQLHGKYLEERERKRRLVADLVSQQAAGDKKPSKRLSRAVGSAAEAAQVVLGARKLSKRINYEALGESVDGMFDAKPAAAPAIQLAAAAHNPSAAAPTQATPKPVPPVKTAALQEPMQVKKPTGSKKHSAITGQPTKIVRPGAPSATMAAETVEPEPEEQEFVAEMGYGGAAGATGVDDYDYSGYDDNE